MLFLETIHHYETKENSKVKSISPNWKLYITMQQENISKKEKGKKTETNLEIH